MIELWLFIAVGAVAVAAAIMMLLSENAVHSALFLIVNFACVAFFYLMLEAPFLAMVQVAVYAGAIMVLFLFVIMLLGAEQAESEEIQMRELGGYRYHTPVALALALILLVTVGVAITRGGIQTLQATASPMLRVIHYTGEANHIDVLLDGEVVASDVVFRDATAMIEVDAGEYELEIRDTETNSVLLNETIEVETASSADEVMTVLAYGTDSTTLGVVHQEMGAPPERQARVVVFNGLDEPISLQDTGIFGREGDAYVHVSNLAPGEASEPLLLDEGTYDSLRFVRPADEENDGSVNALFTIREREFERDTSNLLVIRSQVGSEFAEVGFTQTETFSGFGSPKAVGQLLFTKYILPFEVVSLLLLAALVGVIIIAQRQVAPSAARSSAAGKRVRRRVSRPITSVIGNQVGVDGSDSPQLGSGPAGD